MEPTARVESTAPGPTAPGLSLPAAVDTDAADESMASDIQMEPTARVESTAPGPTAPGLSLPAAVDTDATGSAATLQIIHLPTVSTDTTGEYCAPQLNVSMFYSAKTRKHNVTEADETDKLKRKHMETVSHGTRELSAILGENKECTVNCAVRRSGRMRIRKKDKDFTF